MYQSMSITRDLTSALAVQVLFLVSVSHIVVYLSHSEVVFSVSLRISSLCFLYGKLKFMNFGSALNLLQDNKNLISNKALSHFKDDFSTFRKVLTDINPLYLLTMSSMFP